MWYSRPKQKRIFVVDGKKMRYSEYKEMLKKRTLENDDCSDQGKQVLSKLNR